MGWIKLHFVVLKGAAGHRKIILSIAILVCVILGTVDYLENTLRVLIEKPLPSSGISGLGTQVIAGVPSWILGITLLCLFLFLWMFEYACKLQRQLTPKLHVDFDEKSDIVISPIEIHSVDSAGRRTIESSHSAYVRIKLSALTHITVRECYVFLTKIEKQRIPTAPFSLIPMSSNVRLTQNPVDVPPRVPQMVDFLSSGKKESELSIAAAGTPFTLRDVFKEAATYRLTMTVISGGIVDKEIVVDIYWAGKWDAIDGRKVRVA